MTNTFTLDAIREETLRRYAPTKVELPDGSTVVLKSILKLKEKSRAEVLKLVDEIPELSDVEDDDDIEDYAERLCSVVGKIFALITSQPQKIMDGLDHDDPEIKASLYTSLLNKWIGSSQLGEAKSSPA